MKKNEYDIVNKAYGRKQKMYLPSNIKDHNPHQSPIRKIVSIRGGRFTLVLEEYSVKIKVYDQKLYSPFQMPSSDMAKYVGSKPN